MFRSEQPPAHRVALYLSPSSIFCFQSARKRALSANVPKAAEEFVKKGKQQQWPDELKLAAGVRLLQSVGLQVIMNCNPTLLRMSTGEPVCVGRAASWFDRKLG